MLNLRSFVVGTRAALRGLVRARAGASRPMSHAPPTAAEAHGEARLLDALLRGDDAAWRSFQANYGGPMRRAIVAVRSRFPRLMSIEDVSDVHAELCLQLLRDDKRRLRQFEPSRGI